MKKRAVWLGILLLVVIIFSSERVIAGWCTVTDTTSCSIANNCDVGEHYVAPDDYGYCNAGCWCETNPGLLTMQENCEANNGIYCSNDNCLYPDSKVSSNVNCVVSTSQIIDTRTTKVTNYYADILTINSGVSLHFINSQTTSIGGGIKGVSGVQSVPYRGGGPGGNGGDGGLIFNKGAAGTGTHEACSPCETYCGTRRAGNGGNPGARVAIYAMSKVTNNGIISVDGQRGQDGANGEGECDAGLGNGQKWGNYGTGGGGGGGGGELTLTTIALDGTTGIFSAKGGNNGYGGVGGTKRTYKNIVYDCTYRNDHGAPAGYGGAGEGGLINIYADNINSHFEVTQLSSYNISGGITTYETVPNGKPPYNTDGQCGFNSDLTNTVETPGNNGKYFVLPKGVRETVSVLGEVIYNACNDGIDNDDDNLIDMADSDCYPGPGGDCTSPTTNSFGVWYLEIKNVLGFYPSAFNGSDGCCGDDLVNISLATPGNYNYLGDYGFIHNINGRQQFLCYQQNMNLSKGTYTDPAWLDAVGIDKYKIKTVKTLSGDVDVVSNAKNWYYCNATGNSALQGIPIAEGKTFGNNVNINGELSCADAYTIIFKEPFKDSCASIGTSDGYSSNCCYAANGDVPDFQSDVMSCDCWFVNNVRADPSKIYPTPPTVSSESLILTSNAINELKLDASSTDPSTTGGVDIFGNSIVYDLIRSLFTTSFDNSSFICFKENNSDIISQCCFSSDCINSVYNSSSKRLSYFNKRVLSAGSSIHTLENFDSITKPKSSEKEPPIYISGESMKYYLRGGNVNNFKVNIISSANPSLDKFDYIEFDIIFNSENKYFGNILKVSVNDGTSFNLSSYYNNGDRLKTWHHVIIPIKDTGIVSNTYLKKLTFSAPAENKAIVILDNIILNSVNDSNRKVNTQNYYCSGVSWVDDLDPPTINTNDVKIYAPYKLACINIPSYNWTGTQCCGDDTRLNSSNKEYFNDTEYGCFEGTLIKNDSSIAAAKGYTESTNKNIDELSKYNRNNLMYFDYSFKGCQIPNNNISLNKYYDELTNGGSLLSTTDYIKNQCAVIGKYYCRDGVWRQKIDTTAEDDNDVPIGTDNDFNALNKVGNNLNPRYTASLQLKTIPSGTELIQNGFKSN